MTRAAITVRATWERPRFTGGSDREYTARKAWRIHDRDAGRRWGWYVVDAGIGLTIVRDGVMVDCWHAGISPGDLARLHG
jgi:hypothetical protein